MEKTIYKGYTIEKDPEPWVEKYMAPFRIYYGEVLSDQRIHYADSIPQAKGIIDSELILEDPSREFERLEGVLKSTEQSIEGLLQEIAYQRDQLKLARQCIEANKDEFTYRSQAGMPGAAIARHHVDLCTTALSHLPEFPADPDAAAANEVITKLNEK